MGGLNMLRRRLFGLGLLLAGSIALSAPARAQTEPAADPLLLRIKFATVAAPNVDEVKKLYADWLGYKERRSGTISKDSADSWGTPKMAGHKYVVMSSDGSPDVYIRIVQTDAPAGYKAMTTWGWNSWEIIVDDVDALFEKLKKSPFKIIGEPHPLASTASIHAMQVRGPANEVLYLTMQTGDRSNSRLPLPGAFVGRPFILVLAGPDLPKVQSWYADTFHMAKNKITETPINVIRDAQGTPNQMYPLTTLSLKQHGNLMELDGYPATTKARPRVDGQLPPGNAIASFAVASLDALKLNYIAPPKKIYGEQRAATVVGPAGELIELIEDTTVGK
jgi:hypothetical protein